MNRTIVPALIPALIIITVLSLLNEPAWSEAYRRVNALSGLRVRENPQLNAKVVATLQHGLQVELLEEKDPEITIDGIKGKWSKISYEGTIGWAFGGFLADEEKVLTIEKIMGGTFTFTEIDGADSTSFSILPGGDFKAECLLHGSGSATIEADYRVVPKKLDNTIRLTLQGTAHGRHVAEVEKRWTQKFTNGEVIITLKDGVYRGTLKCPICGNFTDKKLSVEMGK